jgi:DNA-binding protein Fis
LVRRWRTPNQHAGGNRSQVARLLDVSYPTVAKKIADYGIKIPD